MSSSPPPRIDTDRGGGFAQYSNRVTRLILNLQVDGSPLAQIQAQ